ncbi:Hsp20 family protein [Thalassotalea euphylliae]
MMNSVDLSPLYRSSIGFDGLSGLLDNALAATNEVSSYPAYNIEVVAKNCYAITIAAAGFADDELNIQVEHGELTVSGEKLKNANRQYLHHGIITQSFERKFTLAEYVEVTRAKLSHGLLVIELVKTLPESTGATCIAINHPYKPANEEAAKHSANAFADENANTNKSKPIQNKAVNNRSINNRHVNQETVQTSSERATERNINTRTSVHRNSQKGQLRGSKHIGSTTSVTNITEKSDAEQLQEKPLPREQLKPHYKAAAEVHWFNG